MEDYKTAFNEIYKFLKGLCFCRKSQEDCDYCRFLKRYDELCKLDEDL